MKTIYLAITLICGVFSTQSWAPPIKGGATGGATGAPDISQCDLNPSKQTKIKVKDKSGKEHFICTGQATCGGKTVPISCKVSEREPCPVAKQCIEYEILFHPHQIWCRDMDALKQPHCSNAKPLLNSDGESCFGSHYWRVRNQHSKKIYVRLLEESALGSSGYGPTGTPHICFELKPSEISTLYCQAVDRVNMRELYRYTTEYSFFERGACP